VISYVPLFERLSRSSSPADAVMQIAGATAAITLASKLLACVIDMETPLGGLRERRETAATNSALQREG
jgi:hypothetical protein